MHSQHPAHLPVIPDRPGYIITGTLVVQIIRKTVYMLTHVNDDDGFKKKNATGLDEVNYTEFCTPYSGLQQVIRGDGHYNASQRFGLYRWHITDLIRFDKDLRVTIQDPGWRSEGRYLPLQDDIATTVFWYQTEPHAPFPPFPDKDALEVN